MSPRPRAAGVAFPRAPVKYTGPNGHRGGWDARNPRERRRGEPFVRPPRRNANRRSPRASDRLSPDPEGRLHLCPLASVRARRRRARDLSQLDAPRSLALPDRPRHEPVGPEGYRLTDYEGDERRQVLEESGWFRFSVVRNPATRLWSAWQSKILLREPRFVEDVRGGAVVSAPARGAARGLVEDFRRFMQPRFRAAMWRMSTGRSSTTSRSSCPSTTSGGSSGSTRRFALLSEHVGRDLGSADAAREPRRAAASVLCLRRGGRERSCAPAMRRTSSTTATTRRLPRRTRPT